MVLMNAHLGLITKVVIAFTLGVSSAYGQRPIPAYNGRVQPLTPELMVSLRSVSGVLPNPKGSKALFTQSQYFTDTDVRVSSILSLDFKTNTINNQTHLQKKGISNAIWLNDEKFLFLNSKAIWQGSLTPEEPKVVLNFTKFPIDSFKLNLKANKLVFASYIDKPDPKKKFDSALVYDQLMVRHWDHFVKRGIVQLFSVNLSITESNISATSEPINLLKDTELESPVDYSGSSDDYNISPDGQTVAFGAKKPGNDQAWSTEQNIYVVPTDGSKSPKDLTLDNQGACTRPTFSPDGKYLLWLQMNTPKSESDKNNVLLYELKSGKKKFVASHWDRSPKSPQFSTDSSKVFVLADEMARQKLFSLDIASGQVKTLVDSNYVSSFNVLNSDKLWYLKSSISKPNDIYSVSVSGANSIQHTKANQDLLKGVYSPEIEDFWFKGAKNETVHGFIVKPINFCKSKKYPVSLIIHGGPQSAYSDRFITSHNFVLHASAGRVAVIINFHGSTGYGQDFVESIHNQWGSYPYEDHLKGLAYVGKKFRWIDVNRACTVGTSFGGYMGNWINGHTNQFKCIVMGNGKLDTYHTYFSTDELWFPEYDFDGSAIDNEAAYRKWSPEQSAKNFQTPTLVIQGNKDYRIVDGEALGLFTLLQRKGVESRLVYFPDEGHGVSKPGNNILVSHQIIDWVTKFTKKN